MRRKSFAEMECSIARSLHQAGDGWTQLILRNAFLGARRFQEFQEGLGIPPNTLTRRLESLVENGLFVRRRYAERPLREEYELTAKGLDFLPVLLTLATWGNRWLTPSGVSVECIDISTHRVVEPVVIDRVTKNELRPGKVALRAGPCASQNLREALLPFAVLGRPLQGSEDES